MELVDGADLAGPLALEDAIPIARQIALGLEAAHERGIVHRDLKPANIKLTPSGVVKILDFGLAKSAGEFSAGASGSHRTMSPTLSLAMTQAGTILGTAAYMSPEQARGKPVDKRADIWAFGVVFYEMLTGEQLFGGETITDTLASVVKDAPDLNKLPPGTPPHIRRLLERCLRKDPNTRMRDIGEARLMLDEPEAAVAPAPIVAARRAWLPWVVAGLAVLAAAGVWLRPKAQDPGSGVVRFSIPYPAGTSGNNSPAAAQAVPSPDGRYLVFAAQESASGKDSLWVRPLDSPTAHRLDNTEEANYPFWSPDSQSIGFFAADKLKRVSVAGGSVQTICSVSTVGTTVRTAGDGGAWGRDGTIIFGSFLVAPLMKVPAMGGVPTPVSALAKDERSHGWPQLLPDGRHVLYFAVGQDPESSAIYVQEPGSAKRVLVLRNPTRGVWAPPGYLLFVRETTLFAQRMNAASFQLEGEPLAIAHEVTANDSNGRSAFAVSQNGVLAYRLGAITGERQLTWRDREGKVLGIAGKPGEFDAPALSPDEKSAAIQVGMGGRGDTWVMELASGVLLRMTRNDNSSFLNPPVWSPDSKAAGRVSIPWRDSRC
jgi:hypothetical protein